MKEPLSVRVLVVVSRLDSIPEESPISEVPEIPETVQEIPTLPAEINLEETSAASKNDSKEKPKVSDTQMYISLATLGCLILMSLFNFYRCLFIYIPFLCSSRSI